MKNDKVKKWLCLILIFGGFFILRNFIPSGLDQAGWDGFLVLFVAVLLADRGSPHGCYSGVCAVFRRMGRL